MLKETNIAFWFCWSYLKPYDLESMIIKMYQLIYVLSIFKILSDKELYKL